MNMEEILDFQRATPFTGYIIHLSDGRSLEVEHPEFLARSPLGRSIVVYGPLGSLEVVDLRQVVSLELLNGQKRRSPRRKSK